MVSGSSNRTKTQSGAVQESILEREIEDIGVIEQAEIRDLHTINPQNNKLNLSTANSTPQIAQNNQNMEITVGCNWG